MARHIMVTAPPTDVDNMDFDSFDKWQRSKDCVLLHDAEGFDIIKEDHRIALSIDPNAKKTNGEYTRNDTCY